MEAVVPAEGDLLSGLPMVLMADDGNRSTARITNTHLSFAYGAFEFLDSKRS